MAILNKNILFGSFSSGLVISVSNSHLTRVVMCKIVLPIYTVVGSPQFLLYFLFPLSLMMAKCRAVGYIDRIDISAKTISMDV